MQKKPPGLRNTQHEWETGVRISDGAGMAGREGEVCGAGGAEPVPVQTNLFTLCSAMKLSTETMESILASSVLRNLIMLYGST